MHHPLDADMPPFLTLADSTGSMRYRLTFEHGFGADPSGQVVAPFSWQSGPPDVPETSALKFTASATVELLAMPPAERWDRIRTILQRKYAGQDAFIPSDGRLMITAVDLTPAAD
ncbi:MAG TPA: hypothetical protein VIX35_02430 [Vicinamibacterales bacterium]